MVEPLADHAFPFWVIGASVSPSLFRSTPDYISWRQLSEFVQNIFSDAPVSIMVPVGEFFTKLLPNIPSNSLLIEK